MHLIGRSGPPLSKFPTCFSHQFSRSLHITILVDLQQYVKINTHLKFFKLHSTILFATNARVLSISKIHGVIYLNLKGAFHLSEKSWQNQLGHQENSAINLLSPNSDQHQIFSPDNIHMLPREIVMRVNKMITKEKMP